MLELGPSDTTEIYPTHTDQARHEVAVSSLLRLLDAAEADTADEIAAWLKEEDEEVK